jgi:uncharacterized protein (TIRG00374 family)
VPSPVLTLPPEHLLVIGAVVCAVVLLAALVVGARHKDWWPRGWHAIRGRRGVLVAAIVVIGLASLIIILTRLGQLDSVVARIEHASPALLVLAVAFEALSFAGYVALTRAVFRPAAPRVSWMVSLDITLAGVVATRLLTAGGIGGIALTVWALRAAGLDAREAARRMAAFLVILYAVFFTTLFVGGIGLAAGILGGRVPSALAVFGSLIGLAVIGLALATLLVPSDIEARTRRAAQGEGRIAHLASRLVTLPAIGEEAVRLALRGGRATPSAPLAAIAWWAFDIAVLWATFEMFGQPPAGGTLIFCYFLGQVAQLIPIPGGIGPVEGGMIAAFAASGVPLSLAVVAVLTYQAISTWLPALPGLWGYMRLRQNVAAWRRPSPAPPAA